MIAHGYIRYSSAKQGEGTTVERQAEEIDRMIARNGWITGRKIVDRGLSASKGLHLTNGELGVFVQEAVMGLHNNTVLVLEKLDRLSRLERNETRKLVSTLTNFGVNIAVWSSGKLYRANEPMELAEEIGFLVEAESNYRYTADLGDRVRKGKAIKVRERAGSGRITRLSPAWISQGPELQAVIDEERAALVLRWFEMTDRGIGTSEIQRTMERERIPTWGKSVVWHRTYIAKVLANRAVIGELQPMTRLNGKRVPDGPAIPDYYPAIVPVELFERVASGAAVRKATMGGRRHQRISNLFSGLTKCAECGGSVYYELDRKAGKKVRNSANGKHYVVHRDRGSLVCRTAKASGGVKCSNRRAWAYLTFEDALIAAILPLAMDDHHFANQGEAAQLASWIAKTKANIQIKTSQAQNLWDAYSRTGSKNAMDVALNADERIKAEERELLILEERLKVARGRVSSADHLARIEDLVRNLHHPDLRVRLPIRKKVHLALSALIEKIEFGSRAKVTLAGVAGIVFVDRRGETSGWSFLKKGEGHPDLPDYRKRLNELEDRGESPFVARARDSDVSTNRKARQDRRDFR